MTYTKFVEIGRVCYIAFGPNAGNLCVIVDLIDSSRMLVDGPCSGVTRQSVNLKCLYLTKFKVRIPHSAREATVRKAWLKAEIDKKWAESKWAKRLASAKLRANCTDFDRFRLMKAKQQRNTLIRLEAGRLRAKLRKEKAGKPAAAAATKAKKPAAKAAGKK